MATIDEELAQLERDIRQLKIEYDQYFGGGRKRPPTEIEWRIELLVKRYAERGGDLKYGQRFRLNNLTQTYAKYKDIFRKKTQQKEEGKVQRHFGAAAKAIEAERAHKNPEKLVETHVETPVAPAVIAPTAAQGAFRVTCSEPEREVDKVDQLYQAFLQAKQQAGEQTEKLSRSSFNEFVLKKTKDLQKQKNCRDVEYVVEVIDGQVKLKALVKA
jgi:CHAT domain-containing protein